MITVKFESDERDWDVLLTTLKEDVRVAARRAGEDAATDVVTFLVDAVYATEPGTLYQRTEAALNQVGATFVPRGDLDFLVEVHSDAEYADRIEQGNELSYFEQITAQRFGMTDFVPQVGLAELMVTAEQFAEVGADLRELYQRSGQNYQAPGPHVTPAAVSGAFAFKRLLEQRWNRSMAQDAARRYGKS